jgi:hypothetical protein
MRWVLTTVHLLALLLALSIPLYFFDWATLFTWHPTLMALAFLGFMTEGVVTAVLFRAKDGQERVRAIQKHLVWQALGFACLVGGFVAIYQNKARRSHASNPGARMQDLRPLACKRPHSAAPSALREPLTGGCRARAAWQAALQRVFDGTHAAQVLHGKPHYTSLHSRFGLAVLVLGCIAPAGGVVSFRRFGLLQRFPEKAQTRLKWLHRNVRTRFSPHAARQAVLASVLAVKFAQHHSLSLRCVQLGMVTWLLALVTILLGLAHASVWKVRQSLHQSDNFLDRRPGCQQTVQRSTPWQKPHRWRVWPPAQGVLSWLWQAGIVLLGAALLLLALLQLQPKLPTSSRPDFELSMEPAGGRKHAPAAAD